MTKKYCSKCSKRKSTDGFYKARETKDGLRCWCKTCMGMMKKKTRSPSESRGTLSYFKMHTWVNINGRTVNGSHPVLSGSSLRYIERGQIELRMSKEEFYSWCDTQQEKILLLYKNGDTPSIDRKNPSGHYEIKNLQILSWRENTLKGVDSFRKKASVPVVATNVTTGEVRVFESTAAAVRAGFPYRGAIFDAINGKKPQYKGYTWKIDSTLKEA